MTYLELVNSILRRLREDQVGSVEETEYSKLVGAFVNDAKRIVEDAWPWRTLIRTVEIPVTAGINTFYDLEDYLSVPDGLQFNTRAKVFADPSDNSPNAYIITLGREREIPIVPRTYSGVNRINASNTATSSNIEALTLYVNPAAANGKSNLRFYLVPPISAENETIQIDLVNPSNDFTGDGEVLLVAEAPVIQLAYLYCLYERGEEIGEFLTVTSMKAEQALSDAIMLDSMMTSGPAFEAT